MTSNAPHIKQFPKVIKTSEVNWESGCNGDDMTVEGTVREAMRKALQRSSCFRRSSLTELTTSRMTSQA